MVFITGKTQLLGIIADPVDHLMTPERMNDLFQKQGSDAVLVPMKVAAENLRSFFDLIKTIENCSGIVVTVPHKTAAASLCDDITDRARLIGAVNVIRRKADGQLIGENLDGEGFLAGLRNSGISVRGLSVFIAGAGGAARAAAFSLAAADVARMTIYNRTKDKALELVSSLQTVFPSLSISVGDNKPIDHDLVVNMTSLGLRTTDPLPIDPESLHDGMIVADAIMKPKMTPLLTVAKQKGCYIHPGLPMLESQIVNIVKYLGIISNE